LLTPKLKVLTAVEISSQKSNEKKKNETTQGEVKLKTVCMRMVYNATES
jgi:hypothetical protein